MSKASVGQAHGTAGLGREMWLARRIGLALVAVACVFAASSCSSSARLYTSLVVKNESVLLEPDINAGSTGWCVVRPTGGDCPEGRGHLPIIAQGWGVSGSEAEGYALTTSQVAAVSVAGGAPVPTRAESGLPDGLRAVAVTIHGLQGQLQSNLARLLTSFTPLSGNGQPITQLVTAGPPLSGNERSRSLPDPARPTIGACRLQATPLSGLVVQGGSVLTMVRPSHPQLGREFISCASTSYSWHGWSLLAGVLLDASRPGAVPAPLPAMRPLAGHAGIFQAPGFEGQMTARRIPGAWLVVCRAKLQQRLALLDHLRATTHV